MTHRKVEKIEELREKCNFKKKKIAKSLDVTPQTYSSWLSGGYGPTKENLKKIEDLIPNLKDASKLING